MYIENDLFLLFLKFFFGKMSRNDLNNHFLAETGISMADTQQKGEKAPAILLSLFPIRGSLMENYYIVVKRPKSVPGMA